MQSCVNKLPDYAILPNEGMALSKVGITEVRQYRRDFSGVRALTEQAVYVDLVGRNGIHMSRLRYVIETRRDANITLDNKLLNEIRKSQEARTAYWECKWETAFITETEQELFIQCMLEGIATPKTRVWYLTVMVPYASVCPCASSMCADAEYGYPHMQRATTKITMLLGNNEDLDEILTSVVAATINAVKLIPVPYMKREQELEWCQKAEDYPMFVEDAARAVGKAVSGFAKDWVVVCKHFESIHQHNVVGICRAGKRLV